MKGKGVSEETVEGKKKGNRKKGNEGMKRERE
jgi:hypothetical protein